MHVCSYVEGVKSGHLLTCSYIEGVKSGHLLTCSYVEGVKSGHLLTSVGSEYTVWVILHILTHVREEIKKPP